MTFAFARTSRALTVAAPQPAVPSFVRRHPWLTINLIGLTLLAVIAGAIAAGTGGTALQGAYTLFNDMVNGYGKSLLLSIGFALTLIAWWATQATGVILKFVGWSIFAAVGLPAAIAMVGAVV